MCQHFLFFYCVITSHRTEQTVSEVIFIIFNHRAVASFKCFHCFPVTRFLHASFPPSLVQLEVIEMDCLRLPGTSPDLHHMVCNISDSIYHYIWSHPMAMELTCLLHLALVVDCSATLNHQLESPCVSLPHCMHLSDNAELL